MKRHPDRFNGDIPTSSMADIAFLLIIYFVLTMAFSATKGLDLGLPDEPADAARIDPVESIFVEVPAGVEPLSVDGKTMGLEDLLTYLAPKLRQAPGKPVILRTHPEARYGRAVDVLDELRQAKQRLGLLQEIPIAIPTQREIDLYWPV
ncbi:MAG: biopolymer transporter ExbD [Deltaproteobacteria bacterium]|nr:biopolymer transporter ExbD [Deltaproteobacteria bacterium]